MTTRNWKIWAKFALVRATKTFFQTAVSMLPVAAMIHEVDWIAVLSTAVLAGVASLCTSLAGIREEQLPDNPSSTN